MRAVLIALLLASCQIDLDHHQYLDAGERAGECTMSTSDPCVAAVSHQELSWLQANVFDKQCTFSGCHDGTPTPAGKVDLRDDMSYTHLVGWPSQLDTSRKLVVAGSPTQSYLMIMLGSIQPKDADPPANAIPTDVGLMPMSNAGNLLCCQKLDSINRWITAGAMQN